MHSDLNARCISTRAAAERFVLVVYTIQEIGHTAHCLLIARPILGADAEHQLVCALTPVLALEETRTLAPQAQLRAGSFGDGLHVLPVRAEHLAGDLERRLFCDAHEELALRFRRSVAVVPGLPRRGPGLLPVARATLGPPPRVSPSGSLGSLLCPGLLLRLPSTPLVATLSGANLRLPAGLTTCRVPSWHRSSRHSGRPLLVSRSRRRRVRRRRRRRRCRHRRLLRRR
mmetsp:Transcript_102306/g.259847  ORF Transcript_102306/g.259847 Transcript_102306/m.259847 type:complete len:229 (-) Transcript_102306:475-1161(-)